MPLVRGVVSCEKIPASGSRHYGWRTHVKKASEYRQHAQECRALAKHMPPGEQRDQLIRMAETWDQLAQERARQVNVSNQDPGKLSN